MAKTSPAAEVSVASEWPGANPIPDTYLDIDSNQVQLTSLLSWQHN